MCITSFTLQTNDPSTVPQVAVILASKYTLMIAIFHPVPYIVWVYPLSLL